MKDISSRCVARPASRSGVRFSTFCALAVATALMLGAPGTGSAQPRGPIPSVDGHVMGRVLVQPRPGLSLAELDNIIMTW